ncbi:MAG: XRE family transcriptional regulator [Alphaproteobacteria bacterium]|nr:XRE family transcriptional regulator [Alphaproteobacteria bacterium]
MPVKKKSQPPPKRVVEEPDRSASGTALGHRVRQMRRAKSWNLSELSKRSGIAVSTLSKVENGILSLNYDRLLDVAHAFDLSLSEFLASVTNDKPQLAPPPTARLSWARRNSGAEVITANYEYHYLCENLQIKEMIPILAVCKARTLAEFGPLLRHDGEEFIFVVKGKVKVHTEYYAPETLEAGEGVYIDSRMGHAYLQEGDETAIIVSVNANHGAQKIAT